MWQVFDTMVVSSFEIVLVHSQCSPCLRGDKSAQNHFTTKTRGTLRTQWDVQLGHYRSYVALRTFHILTVKCGLFGIRYEWTC
jgi:hypothetical protein